MPLVTQAQPGRPTLAPFRHGPGLGDAQWLDPSAYRRHVDDIEALGVLTAASAHGPVVTGDAIHEGVRRKPA